MNTKKFLDLEGLRYLIQEKLVTVDELTAIVNAIGETIDEVDAKIPDVSTTPDDYILTVKNGKITVRQENQL